MRVVIDARTNMEYASFYVYGLFAIFGQKNCVYEVKPFRKLKGFDHYIAFSIHEGERIKKVVIDFTDSHKIDQSALEWSDVYGKINITQEDLDNSDKLMAIGPSFGIRVYSLLETLYVSVSNFLKSYAHVVNRKNFFSNYKAQYKRPKLSDYTKSQSTENYVFFIASLWKRENKTNTFRLNFIKSCRAIEDLTFEGGFSPRTKNDIEGYEPWTTSSRVTMVEYLKKIKKSEVVFNTPAVKGCHGWKLAEYMALGKAIITTPLSRVMPKTTNKILLTTEGTRTDIEDKILQIINNKELRTKLEKEALNYFTEILHPEKVILRLTNELHNDHKL